MTDDKKAAEKPPANGDDAKDEKLSSSKIAKKLGISTQDFLDKATKTGLLELREDKHYLTDAGKAAGGEFRMSRRTGFFFVWPASLSID